MKERRAVNGEVCGREDTASCYVYAAVGITSQVSQKKKKQQALMLTVSHQMGGFTEREAIGTFHLETQ